LGIFDSFSAFAFAAGNMIAAAKAAATGARRRRVTNRWACLGRAGLK